MSKEMKNSVKFGGFVRLTIVQFTNEEAHDPAVEVCRLADNDEGGAEGEEGPMISTQLGTTPIIYCIYCISDKIIYVFFTKIHGFSTKHFSFSMLDLKEIFTPKFLP